MGYCLLAYVVLVHLSIVLAQPALAGLALVALGITFLYRSLGRRSPAGWLGLVAVAAAAAWTVHQGVTLYALYLPPILLPAAMLWWWGSSLRPGQVPFVTRFAVLIRGELSPEYAAYTRGVTRLWVGVFAVLTAAGIGLALWATPEVWSLFTNFLNTVFVGLVFAGEYLYRRMRFRHLEHPGFITLIRQITRAGVRG